MIKVLGARVVAKMPVRPDRLDTGLWIPECANEPPVEAIVLAVGSKMKQEIKVGDRVMFDQYSGLEQEDEDWGEVLILREDELNAVIENTTVEEGKNATL